MNKYAIGFRWVVAAGILQDWFFALPGIFIPAAVLIFAGAEPTLSPVWPAFASLSLLLLSLFYIPGAVDPLGNFPLALLAVLARAGGVMFFFFLYPGRFPPLFGYIDLTFGLVQGTLLALAVVAGPEVQTDGGSK